MTESKPKPDSSKQSPYALATQGSKAKRRPPKIDPEANAKRALAASQRKARRFALQGLYEWLVTGNPIHEIEARARATNDMRTVNLVHYHELLAESVAQAESLYAHLDPLLDRPREQLDKVEHAALLIGAYELSQRLDIPFTVVIDEAIDLVKHYGATDSFNFINAVSDKIARQTSSPEVEALQNAKRSSLLP